MSTSTQKKPLPLLMLSIGFVLFWLFVAAFPFLWTMCGSFKVEGDFFSRADWLNAITGPVTQRQHGSTFTMAGYHGAWIEHEFWRAVVAEHFGANTNRALAVMGCESGGNPNAKNPYSSASGLFQHLATYWPERSAQAGLAGASIWSPSANIAVAAWLSDGGSDWSHWVCKP